MSFRYKNLYFVIAGGIVAFCAAASYVIYNSSFLNKKQLQEQLESDNPGYHCRDDQVTFIEKSENGLLIPQRRPDSSQVYNALLVYGEDKLKNLSALQRANLSFIELDNTAIENLDSLKCICEKIDYLKLAGNNELNDFHFLKSLKKLETLHIERSPGFCDTSLIPPAVAKLILSNTGVTKLELNDPGKIESLYLVDNRNLKNYEQINEMTNLKELVLSSWNSVSLERFPFLKMISFHNSAIAKLPVIPHNKLDLVDIYHCDQLKSISALRGKKIRKLWLIGTDIAGLLPEILSLDVEEVVIGDPAVTLSNPFIGKIALRVKKMRLNSMVIK